MPPDPPVVIGAPSSGAESPFEGVRRKTHQGEKSTVSAYSFEPGATFPMHSHDEEQVTVFLDGQVEVTVEGETRTYRAGETAVIAPGLVHGMTAGADGARFVALVAPRRAHSNAYEIERGDDDA
jgi:quercetin dioxygenase-like cupin family protein